MMKYEDIPPHIRKRMEIDEMIFGNSFCLKKEDGTFKRIDPRKVKINPKTRTFEIVAEKKKGCKHGK